jgi:RNA polymerase-binding transcription factor DksA
MNGDTASTRAMLVRLRDQAQSRAAALDADLRGLFEASRSSNADDEHDPEGTTIAFERAQLRAILDAARRHLADLAAALQRLDAGTYGLCDRCSRAIPAERLAARPAASTCVGCAGRR